MRKYSIFLVDEFYNYSPYINEIKRKISLEELLKVYKINLTIQNELFRIDVITSKFKDEEAFKNDLVSKGIIDKRLSNYKIMIGYKKNGDNYKQINGIIWSDSSSLLDYNSLLSKMKDMLFSSNLLHILVNNNWFCNSQLDKYINVFREACQPFCSSELSQIDIENALTEYFYKLVCPNGKINYINIHDLIILVSKAKYYQKEEKHEEVKVRTLTKPNDSEKIEQLSFF